MKDKTINHTMAVNPARSTDGVMQNTASCQNECETISFNYGNTIMLNIDLGSALCVRGENMLQRNSKNLSDKLFFCITVTKKAC